MRRIRLRAYAKINLYLDVLGRREDGYHEIETVFQSIALHDGVELALRSDGGIHLTCDHPEVPRDRSNVAWKAAEQLLREHRVTSGVHIAIEKRIPVAAGLGGGSADAAAVLVGLNELLQLGRTTQELITLAARVGADVPFCVMGGTAIGRGIGEILTPISGVPSIPLVIANPGFPLSTRWAFEQVHFGLTNVRKNVTILTRSLQAGDWIALGQALYNVFEPIVTRHYPQIQQLHQQLEMLGAVGTSMTGTGPTVFGIYPDLEGARRASQQMKAPCCIATESQSRGVEILD